MKGVEGQVRRGERGRILPRGAPAVTDSRPRGRGTGTSARFRLPENSRAPSDAFLKGKEPGCAGLGRLQPELDESPVMTAIGNQHPCLCRDSCARCAAPN